MKWITREKPKIDRLACPWLIRRFIDKEAEILYVPAREVLRQSELMGATPFDIAGVEFSHYQDRCTFDYFLEKYNLTDPALHVMAPIIRGADTDRHDIAAQASGLWAISAGLAFNIRDDHQLLEQGMQLYDALYSWATHLRNVNHTESATESLLLEVYHKFLKEQAGTSTRKSPAWVTELRAIIQDQIDTNLNISLKEISGELNVHPAYLSREFSRHFDNLSFGDYLRKLRIEKALKLMEEEKYSLSEIGFLTGFSDQSHFTRVFRQITGEGPAAYRKKLLKGKADTKKLKTS
jgi:AraC-like DNA-binding protein